MDRREAMGLTGSGSYYIQRGIPGSAHPPPPQPQQQTQAQPFHGSSSTTQQGFHHFSNSNSPFGSNPNSNPVGFVSVEPSPPVDSSAVEGGGGMVVGSGGGTAPHSSGEMSLKRKRGRPRKYGQDGSVSLALSPSMSSSISPNSSSSNKRGRGRPPGSGKKQRLASIGQMMPSSSGMSFTPHVIVVSVGEDIASKVISFSQQGPRAICVLSACGAVSTATLLQPSPSQGTITYEGRFELISLSTSYLNTTDNNNYPNRTGNLLVSLASPDGRVIGGGIGGPLIAASPVQVIVGSFIWAMQKAKIKKREETAEDVQDTEALDDNAVGGAAAAAATSSPVQTQNLVQAPVGMWSSGSRAMDMHHAHIDIDLMRG